MTKYSPKAAVKHKTHAAIDDFIKKNNIELTRSFTETFTGRYGKMYMPFSMQNVRKLPIVGDVSLSRE